MKKIIAAATFVAMAGSVQAQGIPVLDATSVAQGVQQIAAWAKQYEQMISHYQMLEAQYKNMTGTRGMGALARNASSAIPDGWLDRFKQATTAKEATQLTGEFLQTAMASSQERAMNIQTLLNQVDQTQDAKAAADLQNRITAETALLQNQKIMIDIAKEQRNNQRDAMIQENRKKGDSILFGD